MTQNCPFYGRYMHIAKREPVLFMLFDQRGNQCALITTSYAPCEMEIKGQAVDWRKCPVLAERRP